MKLYLLCFLKLLRIKSFYFLKLLETKGQEYNSLIYVRVKKKSFQAKV